MDLQANTGVEEKEQWRERIMRALQDLRGSDARVHQCRPMADDGADAPIESRR